MGWIVLILIGVSIYFYTKYRSSVEAKDGIQREFYLDGKTPKYSYTKLNGKLDGEWKSFYPTGKLKEKKNFINGVLNGQYISYYPTEMKNEEGCYENGNRNGRWETFYENGDLKIVREYNEGIEDKSCFAEFKEGVVTHLTEEEIDSEEFQDFGYTSYTEYCGAIDEIEKTAKYSPIERLFYEAQLPDQLFNEESLSEKTKAHLKFLEQRGIQEKDINAAREIISSMEDDKELKFEDFVLKVIQAKGKEITQEIYLGLVKIFEVAGRDTGNTKTVYDKLFESLPL